MAIYSLSVTTPAAAAGAAYCDLRTGATQRAYIREIGFSTNAATASSVGLGRPATLGTASTTTAPLAVDPADATALSLVGTAWSAAPTAPTQFFRRYVTPATAGTGTVWYFDRGGLVVAVSSSIILWNFGGAAGSALSAYIVYEE